MTDKKTRTLPKPFGHKTIEQLSEQQQQALHKALWANVAECLDYEHSPVLAYYNLNCMDGLFIQWFEMGEDISPLTSIADWTSHTFKSSRGMEKLLKSHTHFNSKNNKGFAHLDNSEILIENFLLFSQDLEPRHKEQLHHEVVPQLIHAMTDVYCNYFNSRQAPEEQRSMELFKKLFAVAREIYKGNNNHYHWLRLCLDVLGNSLKRVKVIDHPNEVITLSLAEIEPHMDYLWHQIDFVVKDRLFAVRSVHGDSFRMVENLLEKMGEDSLMASIKKDLHDKRDNKIPHGDKMVYFLSKYWHLLNENDINRVYELFLKNNKPYDHHLHVAKPLLSVITPLEKVLKLFQSSYFGDDIKRQDIFKECLEVLEKRTLVEKLEANLPEKDRPLKIKKV